MTLCWSVIQRANTEKLKLRVNHSDIPLAGTFTNLAAPVIVGQVMPVQPGSSLSDLLFAMNETKHSRCLLGSPQSDHFYYGNWRKFPCSSSSDTLVDSGCTTSASSSERRWSVYPSDGYEPRRSGGFPRALFHDCKYSPHTASKGTLFLGSDPGEFVMTFVRYKS